MNKKNDKTFVDLKEKVYREVRYHVSGNLITILAFTDSHVFINRRREQIRCLFVAKCLPLKTQQDDGRLRFHFPHLFYVYDTLNKPHKWFLFEFVKFALCQKHILFSILLSSNFLDINFKKLFDPFFLSDSCLWNFSYSYYDQECDFLAIFFIIRYGRLLI